MTNDYDFLKIAYEKNIIKALPSSIKELRKEDKDRIKTILTLCHLEEYNLCWTKNETYYIYYIFCMIRSWK